MKQAAPMTQRSTAKAEASRFHRNVFIISNGTDWHTDYQFRDTETLLMQYCGGNTGNIAYVYGATRAIKQCRALYRSPAAVAEKYHGVNSLGVITCANQLGSHCQMKGFADTLSKSAYRLVALGLGVQADMDGSFPVLHPSVTAFVNTLAQRAASDRPNIGLRGSYTYAFMKEIGLADHCEVLGCQSLFVNPDDHLGLTIRNNAVPISRLAVCAGMFHWPKLQSVERQLIKLVEETHGSYIAQHHLDMVVLCRGVRAEMREESVSQFAAYGFEDGDTAHALNFLKKHGQVFFDPFSWMEHYRHFDFCVGARIHGIILALNAGIPALCIVHDARTLELCETMHIPHVRADTIKSPITLGWLQDTVADFDWNSFDRNRTELKQRLRNFLLGNGIEPNL